MIPGPDIAIACPDCGGLAQVFSLISGNTFGAQQWTDGYVIYPMLPQQPVITKCRQCKNYYWLSTAIVVGTLQEDQSDERDEARYRSWSRLPFWLHCLFAYLYDYFFKRPQFTPDPDTEPQWRPLRGKRPFPRNWNRVKHVRELTEKEYLAVADEVDGPEEGELTLRLHAWWASNEPYREADETETFLSISERSNRAVQNLHALKTLLVEPDVNTLIMHAEIARELEQWDLAQEFLERAELANAEIQEPDDDSGFTAEDLRELAPNLSELAGDDFLDSLPLREAAETRIRNRCVIERIRGLTECKDSLVRRIEYPEYEALQGLIEEELSAIRARS